MTTLYLTSASADAEVTQGSGTKWKCDHTAGGSAVHIGKTGVAGPTAPLQVTDGATSGTDGTAVSWYTYPLAAVTISGQITVSLWDREGANGHNIAPTIRIERCSGDGAVVSTVYTETNNTSSGEMPTTAGGASDTLTLSAANVVDTALSDGDRLRITLWIDDAAGQGGTGNMAAAGIADFWVNGPTGSQGQAELAFTETLAPFWPDSPFTVRSVTVGGSQTATVQATTPASPAAQVGDLLLIFHGNNWYAASNMPTPTVSPTATVTAVSGGTADGGTNAAHIKAYTATVATAGQQTVSVTETGTADEEKCMVVYVLAGADTAAPVDAAVGTTGASATSQPAASVSPSTTDALLVVHNNSGGAASGGLHTVPGQMAEQYEVNVANILSGVGAIEQLAASGATGTRTITAATATIWGAVTVAVKAAEPAAKPQVLVAPSAAVSRAGSW